MEKTIIPINYNKRPTETRFQRAIFWLGNWENPDFEPVRTTMGRGRRRLAALALSVAVVIGGSTYLYDQASEREARLRDNQERITDTENCQLDLRGEIVLPPAQREACGQPELAPPTTNESS